MVRRIVVVVLLAALVTPAGAAASQSRAAKKSTAWHSFSSKKLAFALHYPPSWRLTTSAIGVLNQVTLSDRSTAAYGLNVQILPVAAASTLRGTLQRFIAFQRQQHNTIFTRVHWQSVRIGSSAALAGVTRPASTEGGLDVADAVYIAQWHGRTYQILAISYHRPPLSQLRQFPAVYGKILHTWRFL